MPKGSPELTQARREEIMNACETLYQTMGFRNITLKDISKATSFSRPSIYNYFRSKEEIFLAILEREYRLWIADIRRMTKEYPTQTKEEFAQHLSETVVKRDLMLKIISMNHYDMESGSRPERVTEFKSAYGDSLRAVTLCLEIYFPEMKVSEIQAFLYVFFPFLFGIYPYTTVTDKQQKAMEEAGVDYVFLSVYEITYNCIRRLLG